MQVTVICGEDVTSLEIAEDMELENFIALCKIELAPIAEIPFERLQIAFNGQKINLGQDNLKKQLKELDIKNGDAIHIDILPSSAAAQASSSRRQPVISSSTSTVPAPGSNISSLISNLVQGIKLPAKRPAADTPDRAMADNIFSLCADPHRLDFLRAEHPDLALAYEANSNDRNAFYEAFQRHKEEMARRARVMQDETSEEGQRFIAEMIERQNIEFMHEFAMEHMPEAFIPVQMLYIRMMINNHPVIAFVDSGAQTSIISESCAKRCNVLRFADRRYRTNAVGIGGVQKMLGRIHSCQVQVNTHIFPCPFEVMADRDIDILFGLNTLLRHKCSIDLQKMVLRFGDGTETPFLAEAGFQREKEAVIQDEAATSQTQPDEGKKEEGNGSSK